MPEIKIKHVASFSSEDKVHKAENILRDETYRKWKCATPGEKNASIVLQFEKATQIHSIDIGNESSAFVEVLVGRSSDSVNDFQVLLVASSFMSPLESRNETHTNRVRMFGPDKLAQNLKDEKWDCVQVVCTQPFNKNINYGLSFIKFHSPPEKPSDVPMEKEVKKAPARLGAFKLKYDDDEDNDSSPSIGSWLERKNKKISDSVKTFSSESPSYAAAVLSSSSSPSLTASASPQQKRKIDSNKQSDAPAPKKAFIPVNRKMIAYSNESQPSSSSSQTNEVTKGQKDIFGLKELNSLKVQKANDNSNMIQKAKANVKKPFRKLMEDVVFVISGFVNPLRSEIRDKGLEMGAKYRGDWSKTCTHLICAFVNTPKYILVRDEGGKIVTKDWILDCHKKRALLPWRNYMLGKYSADSSGLSSSDDDEEEEDEEEEIKPKKKVVKMNPKINAGTSSHEDLKHSSHFNHKATQNSKNNILSDVLSSKGKISPEKKRLKKKNSFEKEAFSGSETEDEDAIRDYLADTDVQSDSGGDTEDEIRKVESEAKKIAANRLEENKSKASEEEDDSPSLLPLKPDTKELPLPDLPNFFKKRHFFLYGNFPPKKHHDLQRFITAYSGVIDDYMGENTKYVVTESKWDANFDEALNENEDLIFVKPEWVFKCNEAQKLVPYQPYIVIPNS